MDIGKLIQYQPWLKTETIYVMKQLLFISRCNSLILFKDLISLQELWLPHFILNQAFAKWFDVLRCPPRKKEQAILNGKHLYAYIAQRRKC